MSKATFKKFLFFVKNKFLRDLQAKFSDISVKKNIL